MKSNLSYGVLEVLGDQRPDLLRAAVVGVVVAGAQRVGAEHDPALDLGAEARLARLGVHLQQRAGLLAEAEADAVVAGEVGAALRGRDQVVRGQAVRRVREVRGLDRRAELARDLERLLERLQHARLDALAGELLRHAEADALEVVSRSGCAPAPGRPRLVLVARVGADHRGQQHRAVGHVARERARLVQGGREGDHPVAADGAVRGLEPDDAGERGGLADRAAGVRADRPRRRAAGDDGRGAAGRAAGDARGVPRVERRVRRRSSRWRSPSRTRPGWSCRAACRRRSS